MLPRIISNVLLVSVIVILIAPVSTIGASFASTSSSATVSSNGTTQSMLLVEVVPYSPTYKVGQPIQAYTISGAMPQCLRSIGKSQCQEWFQMFINPSAPMFDVNQTNAKAEVIVNQKSPTLYYDIAVPGTTTILGTIGQDTDTANGTLSEWQWVNPNHYDGEGRSPNPPASTSGSFDGGGPAGCSTNSGGSYHISDYTVVTDQKTGSQARIMGVELIESQFGSKYSLTALVFVNIHDEFNAFANGLHGINQFSCKEVMAPSDSPQLRWFVREAPLAGAQGSFSIHGNFGVISTEGASIRSTTTDQLLQDVNVYSISGFMPAQICATCVLPATS